MNYAQQLALGMEPDETLVDSVMNSFGLTKEGTYKYSGLCRSDGIYTVTFNPTTKMIKEIACSKHGNTYDDLVVSDNIMDYLGALKSAFQQYMSDPKNAAKVGSSYQWDSNGTLYTPEVVTLLNEQLKTLGFKSTDTSMWKVQYNKSKGYVVYWLDTGKEIKQEGTYKNAGKKVYVNLEGNATYSDFDAIVKNHTVVRGDKTEKYLTIDNARVKFL